MTHWISVKEAPSERPIAGRETATILESSMIKDDTSDDVSRIQNPDGAAAWFWSAIAVIARLLDSVGLWRTESETEPQTWVPELRGRYAFHSHRLSAGR